MLPARNASLLPSGEGVRSQIAPLPVEITVIGDEPRPAYDRVHLSEYFAGRKPEELAKQLQESGRLMEVANDIRQHKAIEVFLQAALGESSDADTTEENVGTE